MRTLCLTLGFVMIVLTAIYGCVVLAGPRPVDWTDWVFIAIRLLPSFSAAIALLYGADKLKSKVSSAEDAPESGVTENAQRGHPVPRSNPPVRILFLLLGLWSGFGFLWTGFVFIVYVYAITRDGLGEGDVGYLVFESLPPLISGALTFCFFYLAKRAGRSTPPLHAPATGNATPTGPGT